MIQDPNNSELQPHYSCTISSRRATIWKHEQPVYRLALAGGNNSTDYHFLSNDSRMGLDAQMLVDLRRSVPAIAGLRFEINPNTYELDRWSCLSRRVSQEVFAHIITYVTNLLNEYHGWDE